MKASLPDACPSEIAGDPEAGSPCVASPALEEISNAKCALAACGVRIAEKETRECARLLSLLRRRLKVATAFIVENNANRLLFATARNKRSCYQSFVVSPNIQADPRVSPDLKERLCHCTCSYIGVDVHIQAGRRGTLVLTSPTPQLCDSEEMYLLSEIVAMIEDRYCMRRNADIANTVTNLSIVSVLLSGIKSYLSSANSLVQKMDEAYRDILPRGESGTLISTRSDVSLSETPHRPLEHRLSLPLSLSLTNFRKSMQSKLPFSLASSKTAQSSTLSLASPSNRKPTGCCLSLASMEPANRWHKIATSIPQLAEVNKLIQSSIERALMVARYYTCADKTSYYVSCFQTERTCFVKSMNTVLQGLTRLMPEHSLMWSFDIDCSLVRCAHRTFYAHLMFFLEGLVFRWAKFCASAQISISFEAHGILEPAPIKQTGAQSMGSYSSNSTVTSSSAQSASRSLDSNDGDCSFSRQAYSPRLQHGYLRIFFQPLDTLDGMAASKGLPLDHLCGTLVATPTDLQTVAQKRALALYGTEESAKGCGSSKGSSKEASSGPATSESNSSEMDEPTAVSSSSQHLTDLAASEPSVEGGRGESIPSINTAILQSVELMRVMSEFLRSVDPNSKIAIAPFELDSNDAPATFMLSIPCHFHLPTPPGLSGGMGLAVAHAAAQFQGAARASGLPAHGLLRRSLTQQPAAMDEAGAKQRCHMSFGGKKAKPELDYRYHSKDCSGMEYGPRIRGKKRTFNNMQKVACRSASPCSNGSSNQTPCNRSYPGEVLHRLGSTMSSLMNTTFAILSGQGHRIVPLEVQSDYDHWQ